MEKFLSIPVLDAGATLNQNQLVSITGIKRIGQPTTTTATLIYLDGEVTTLTWPTITSRSTKRCSISIKIRMDNRNSKLPSKRSNNF